MGYLFVWFDVHSQLKFSKQPLFRRWHRHVVQLQHGDLGYVSLPPTGKTYASWNVWLELRLCNSPKRASVFALQFLFSRHQAFGSTQSPVLCSLQSALFNKNFGGRDALTLVHLGRHMGTAVRRTAGKVTQRLYCAYVKNYHLMILQI